MSQSNADDFEEQPVATVCTCDITVYFGTGLEYVEGPLHFSEFGGEEDSMFDVTGLIWRRRDRERVWGMLEYEGMWPPLELFPDTPTGTQALYTLLREQGYPTKFAFGLLIWHQLGYRRRLTASYQGGQCGSAQCWHREH